ncbi:metal ABC transporter ATP-binding protein [Brachybacterium paraconglomeratum]|uniref:metal ABC transporter ATP-binding protein n=1 Tax=Brachybacterium paraconglomeratum TaxID=173362 RepID=UPI0022E51B48|nr:metal ABC transporter ATP-binding protein [Brachybacterium paraconglomeratum]
MSIRVEDLTVRYGEVTALDGLSVHIAAGEVTGLVGMNGAGKSTLFGAIMGTVPVESGRIEVDDEEPVRARRRGAIGYVPQGEAIDASFPVSVADVVMMGRYGHQGLTRRPRPADHRAVAEALARVELTDLARRPIGRLSGGQRRRAFVARGLAQGARTLLLDEPFAGVDKRSEALLVGVLRELAADDCTVLVSTHDLHALPDLAHSAVLLRRRLLFHGTVAEALEPAMLARAFGLDPRARQEVAR